jgi:hypothetical protein
MGLENVKSNIQAQTTTSVPAMANEEEDDDLPF